MRETYNVNELELKVLSNARVKNITIDVITWRLSVNKNIGVQETPFTPHVKWLSKLQASDKSKIPKSRFAQIAKDREGC